MKRSRTLMLGGLLVLLAWGVLGCARKVAPSAPVLPARPGARVPTGAPRTPPGQPKAPSAAATRPATLAAPTPQRPLALWAETTQPIVDWKTTARLGLEKLPGAKHDEITLAAKVRFAWPPDREPPTTTVYLPTKTVGDVARIDLGPLADAVRVVLFFGRPDLVGKGTLTITAGEGVNATYKPLSNETSVPFEVTAAGSKGP